MSTGNGTLLESDKYHVIRELGRGGMGVVYLAEDRQLRRQVALKVLYDYLNRDQAFVERFQEEARSVSSLHHPNIVCIHGLERAGDVLAIDMEYVEGSSLGQFTSVSPHLAASIARDVLGGLAACHHIGVVHRDIKPSNILLNVAGQAKITDFGLATAYASHVESSFHGSSSSGFYMGTPRYMPVQAWEGAPPEPCWDLYSLGVVLHELLSGRPAFKGDNPVAVMRLQLTDPLPALHVINEDISPEMSAMVDALLDASRKQTGIACSDAFEMLRESPEFKALNQSDGVSTVPALPRPRSRKLRPAPFKLRAWAAVWAVGIALVGGVALYGVLAPRGPAVPVQVAAIPASGAAFYDGELLGQADSILWMVETDAQGHPARLTGQSPMSLWVLDIVGDMPGGHLAVRGHWAARFSDESAASEWGTMDGTLYWEATRDQPVLNLFRTRGRDREQFPLTFACRRKSAPYDRTAFLRSLEENAVAVSLLYAELLPRDLPWAVALEGSLPSMPGARVAVPTPAGPITVDGVLDEPTWANGAYDATGLIGELAPQVRGPGGNLQIRWDAAGVYIAATCSGPATSFEIAIAPGVEIFPLESGRFVVKLAPDGAITGNYYEGGRRSPWPFDWNAMMKSESGETRVEIGVPTETLSRSGAPEAGRRWRVNARFTTVNDGEVRWGAGDGDLRAVEHGALLVFQQEVERDG